MKIIKFPQSCFIIEKNNKRLLIDPGSLLSPNYTAKDLLPIDAIVITHGHLDHVDTNLLDAILKEKSVPVISNIGTKEVCGDLITRVVTDGEEFDLAGFQIKTYELPHCLMVDGSPGPQNTGYLIDDIFFHPGDGTEISDVIVPNIAIPITGPDISSKDCYSMILSTGATTVIPMHNDYFNVKIDPIISWINRESPEIRFVVLENGATITF